jgi:hypothetical protein
MVPPNWLLLGLPRRQHLGRISCHFEPLCLRTRDARGGQRPQLGPEPFMRPAPPPFLLLLLLLLLQGSPLVGCRWCICVDVARTGWAHMVTAQRAACIAPAVERRWVVGVDAARPQPRPDSLLAVVLRNLSLDGLLQYEEAVVLEERKLVVCEHGVSLRGRACQRRQHFEWRVSSPQLSHNSVRCTLTPQRQGAPEEEHAAHARTALGGNWADDELAAAATGVLAGGGVVCRPHPPREAHD